MTGARRRFPFLAFALAWTLLAASATATAGFRIKEVETRVVGGMLVMDARIRYGFSEAALEALDNGVPLTLEVHIQLRRADAWVWEENLVDERLRYLIRYKPLSERYLVARLPGDEGTGYVTRDAAIAALGEIEDLQLVAKDRLEAGEAYEIHMQASLDIDELPLPLKPAAYLLPSWKLTTGWTKWPLQP